MILIPSKDGTCVCDYVDIAISLPGDKMYEVEDTLLEMTTCFDGTNINHTDVCAQMYLMETAAINWRMGSTPIHQC